ncbi:MAG: 1-acyl-sn-glycerol-3-phosphate acyltransferase [Silicimonas sp.]|nr:1-acyl-sn-glycerol-3-phosphate acyltransferase [Silicimonas sp.]
MQLVRSVIFNVAIYLVMFFYAIVYFPFALLSKNGAVQACHAWCRFVRWAARVIVGLETEVRGTPPSGQVLLAAKHQSFLDIVLIYGAVPRAKFIMKRELMYIPVIGQYFLRVGAIPVNRGKRGAAITKMLEDVKKGQIEPGQILIYPQGTRVAPGMKKPYKVGAGVLYEQLGQPCVPVATNVGHFWPKRGMMRLPGTAVVEFLDPIEPGLPKVEFMAKLEEVVETASDALLEEARR